MIPVYDRRAALCQGNRRSGRHILPEKGAAKVKRKWIAWGLLGLVSCCSGRGETRVQADLTQGRLCVYQGETQVYEQRLECACEAPPIGEWTLERDGDGYALRCPWGVFRLETDLSLPDSCPVEVLGSVEDCLSLQAGARGAGVYRMQQGLVELGYLDQAPTGLYDARTQAAVYACMGER